MAVCSGDTYGDLRRRLDCADVVSQLGLPSRGRYFRCPVACCWSRAKGKLLASSKDVGAFECFACGTHGDAVDLIKLAMGCSDREAYEYALGLAGLAEKPLPPRNVTESGRRGPRRPSTFSIACGGIGAAVGRACSRWCRRAG